MLPDALVAPGVEVVGDGLPGREVVGQHPPGAAATRQVQDGIDNLPYGVSAWPAGAAIALGKQMFDVVPLGIRQITGIALPCKSIHAQEDNIDWHARERLLSRRPVISLALGEHTNAPYDASGSDQMKRHSNEIDPIVNIHSVWVRVRSKRHEVACSDDCEPYSSESCHSHAQRGNVFPVPARTPIPWDEQQMVDVGRRRIDEYKGRGRDDGQSPSWMESAGGDQPEDSDCQPSDQ